MIISKRNSPLARRVITAVSCSDCCAHMQGYHGLRAGSIFSLLVRKLFIVWLDNLCEYLYAHRARKSVSRVRCLDMARYIHLNDSKALQCKIEARANNLFMKTAEKSSFQVIRLSKPVNTRKGPCIPTFQKNLNVCEVSQINLLKESHDVCQIFIVRHDRCWARLNIERALFEHFINIYEVCEEFWKCVFAFGLKQRENEFEFPRIRSRVRKTFEITNPCEPKGTSCNFYPN